MVEEGGRGAMEEGRSVVDERESDVGEEVVRCGRSDGVRVDYT